MPIPLFDEPGARRIASLIEDAQCHSVLGVFAHPDDEILVAAALTDAVKRGGAVYTVTATGGGRGVPRRFVGGSAELTRVREAELRRFGNAMGVQGQEVWDFPDGELSARPDDLVHSVMHAIRRYRPDIVVTFDPIAGFTGHRDHRRIGEVALCAAKSVGSSESPKYVAQVLFPRRAALFVPDGELRRLLRQQPRADVAMQGNSRMTRLGMEIHRTQRRFFPPQWARPLLSWSCDREYFAMVRLEDARHQDSGR